MDAAEEVRDSFTRQEQYGSVGWKREKATKYKSFKPEERGTQVQTAEEDPSFPGWSLHSICEPKGVMPPVIDCVHLPILGIILG